MPAIALSALRTAAQVVVGYIVTYAAAHGLSVPVAAQDWLVQAIVAGVGIGAWTAGVRYLETRKGSGWWPVLARAAGKVLMFGLSRQPVYPPAAPVPLPEVKPTL